VRLLSARYLALRPDEAPSVSLHTAATDPTL